MVTVSDHGIAKVQVLPFSLWEELRTCSGKEDVISFAQIHRDELTGLLSERISEGEMTALFDYGKVRSSQKLAYISASIKSGLLRAGGSSITSWALWSSGTSGFEKLPTQNTSFMVGNNKISVPCSYTISLDRMLVEALEKATLLLHEAINSGVNNLLTRADYVLDQKNGKTSAWLVDVGESNLTLALTDCIMKAHHLPNNGILETYIKRVLAAYGEIPSSVAIVSEDGRSTEGMSYSLEAISETLRNELSGKGLNSTVSIKSLGELVSSRSLDYDLILRCFRSPACLQKYEELVSQTGRSPKVVGPLEAITHYQKPEVKKAISGQLGKLKELVNIPESEIFETSEGPETCAGRIFDFFRERHIEDVVLKPAIKAPGISSQAYFYNVSNGYHLADAKRDISHLTNAGVKEVIAEQAVGNGVIDGKKTEVKMHVLG
jgi:hypothetical protein